MIPAYERPAASIASQFPTTAQGNASDVAAEIAWREFFTDERLRSLIALALANNRDLQIATLNIEQSAAQHRIQRSASFPDVEDTRRFTRERADDRINTAWTASLGTTAYELDFFGRIRSLKQQAREKYLATVEARRNVQISLVSEVAAQYFTLRQAQAQLELAHQTLATVEESFTILQATFDAGASSELDLRSAETQVRTAQINALTYERLITQTENYLTLLIAQPLPAELPAPGAFDAEGLLADVPVGLPSELVQRRPDILEAEHSLQAANANIGAARAAFFPSVTLTALAGTTSSQFDETLDVGSGWSLSPQITLPMFNAGRNRANLDAAKVGKRIEIANYQKAIETAFREVVDALVGTRTFTEQLQTQAKLIDAQQRRFELATLRYRAGDTAYLDVLTAQQDLYGARQNYLETRLNQLTSRISLYKSLGGGWK